MSVAQRPGVVVITGASAGVRRATAPAFARGEAQARGVVATPGAAAGAGRATAEAFAGRGAPVGLLGGGRGGRDGARRDVGALGGKPLVLPPDGARADAVEAAAAAVEDAFGP